MSSPPGSARECAVEPPLCRQPHRLTVVTVAFANTETAKKSTSTDVHSDLAHTSRHRLVVRPTLHYIGDRSTAQGRDQMLPVELSLLELAPVRFAYRKWVAAGKPCLRQSCGHPHAVHIPSGATECDQCDCARFVGLTHPDDCRCGRRHHHHRLKRPAAHLPERRSNDSPLLRRSRSRGCMGSSDQTCTARMCWQPRCDRPVQPQAGVV